NDFFGIYSARFSLTAGAGAGSGSIGLPVEWRSFETSIEGQSVLLTWSTSLELNNQGFYVERSTDAETWESIGFVEGAGNSQEVQEYSFVDDFPNIGYNYYRLQQVDFNGDNDYSVIREIVLDPGTFTDALNVFPNPVQDILNITPIIGILHIRDLSGRVVYESTLNGARTEISMGAYPSGIYLIEIQPYNQSRKVFRVVH
ncbi:MAG: T9SS type A sorting domain-containing protein, partial [Bacteroidota bacterium]